MSKAVYTLIAIGIFASFIALGIAVPNLESMIINFKNLSPSVKTLFQYSFLVIGFGVALLLMEK